MGRACRTNGEEEESIQDIGGKPEGKKPLGRPRCRWILERYDEDLTEAKYYLHVHSSTRQRDQCTDRIRN
jgi:hypothetical protein